MRDLKLQFNDDGTQEIVVENGDFVFVTGVDYVKQKLRIKLRMFFSEWYLDESLGMKMFENVFVKHPDKKIIDDMFLAAIQEEPTIRNLLDFNSTIDQGRLSISFSAASIYGDIDFNDNIGVPRL